MKSLVISDAGGITNARCHPDWGSSVGMPYCVADNSTSLVPFTPGAFNGDPASDFDYCTECDYGIGGLTGYPVPVEARTDARYMENGEYDRAPGNTGDAHLLIIQKDTGVLYELSYASPISGGKWHAGAGAIFDLNANDRRPDDWTSTDAAGLAVLPGLMRYDEIVILTDPINHAFRTSIRRSNGYVWPASHASGTYAGRPPMGQRLRLKANFDIDSYLNGSFSGGPLNAAQRTAMERIFHAMKTYGLIVADNGGAMYCQGTMDSRWDTFISAELRNAVFHGVNINNFDMLQRGWDGTGGVRGNLEFTE